MAHQRRPYLHTDLPSGIGKKSHLPLQFDHPPVLRRRIVIRRRNSAWVTLENSLKEHMVFPFMNPRFKSINLCEEMISQNYSRSSQCGDRSGMIHLEGRSPEVEALQRVLVNHYRA